MTLIVALQAVALIAQIRSEPLFIRLNIILKFPKSQPLDLLSSRLGINMACDTTQMTCSKPSDLLGLQMPDLAKSYQAKPFSS